MLSMNAEYLCKRGGHYTLQALLRPGIPLAGFVSGMIGVISGGISLIRNRSRKAV